VANHQKYLDEMTGVSGSGVDIQLGTPSQMGMPQPLVESAGPTAQPMPAQTAPPHIGVSVPPPVTAELPGSSRSAPPPAENAVAVPPPPIASPQASPYAEMAAQQPTDNVPAGPPPVADASQGPPPSPGDSIAKASPVAAAPPTSSRVFQMAWQEAQTKLDSGQLADALYTLSYWYGKPDVPETHRQALLQTLDQLAGTVIYSRDYVAEPAVTHQVARGETLQSIADKYQIPAQFVANVNGIRSKHDLIPSSKIKVVRGPFRAEVDLEQRELTVFRGRYYAGRFPIGIGQDLPAVEAEYEVAEKALGRTYFDPATGGEVPIGDPNNPYGGYWIGLRNANTPMATNIGLHGTAPNSDGQEDGRGSAGLTPRGAADVSAILTLGSKVRVRR